MLTPSCAIKNENSPIGVSKRLDRRASAIIICHNHPSGQLRPSEEDLRLTKKLVEGGRLIDITVQDHLIVTSGGYYSFADNGMM